MSRRRGPGAVPLPDNVFRVKRPSGKIHYYFQARRGRPDHGPLVRLPEPNDPEFWAKAKSLNEGGATQRAAAGSFRALIEHYKTETPGYARLSGSSKRTYGIALDAIDVKWGALPVRDLRPKNIYELLDRYADRPSMGNLTVRVLRTLLKEGVKKGYAEINVAIGIEPLSEDVEGSEPWSEATYAHVLKCAPEVIMRAAVLGRATGQRAVDLVRMLPGNRDRNGIAFTVQKLRGVKHFVPIQKEALAVIDGWGVNKVTPYLTIGGRRISEEYLRGVWRMFRSRDNAIPPDATLHDLRAMAVCDRRLQGVAHQQIADQLRMSPAMVMRYSKGIDREANAQAGMDVFERAENGALKLVYQVAETRKPQATDK